MLIVENGITREMTEEEKEIFCPKTQIPYKDRVIARIREKYSVDDELAILRQRDTKPDEWAEYNAFVEQIKTEEKGEQRDED